MVTWFHRGCGLAELGPPGERPPARRADFCKAELEGVTQSSNVQIIDDSFRCTWKIENT
jgi:hypothetical protein